jgi:polar amino acid transport system substrate-binding protein
MLRLCSLGLCLLLTAPFVEAQDKKILKFVADEWPMYTNPDGSGTYWDIVRSVFAEEYELELIITPWARAKNLMNAGRVDALMAISVVEREQLITPNQHIDTEYPILALFDPSTTNITSAQDLTGLTVAGRSQYGFEHFIPKDIHYYGVASIADSNRLLFKRRVDVVLVSSYYLKEADPTATLAHIEIIPEQQLYIGFHNNTLGKKLCTLFDINMAKLIKNNHIKAYFPSEVDYAHAKLEPQQ